MLQALMCTTDNELRYTVPHVKNVERERDRGCLPSFWNSDQKAKDLSNQKSLDDERDPI